MDYKKVLRLHFVNHLSSREIAESCGDCGKTSVNEFLKRFRVLSGKLNDVPSGRLFRADLGSLQIG